MKNWKQIIERILAFFGKKPSQKKTPPQELSSEIMEKIMKEARFLQENHGVEVRNLEKGELPIIKKKQ